MQGDANLKNRITAAAAKTAYYIISAEAPETENHANRLIWAKTVLDNPESMANRMLWGVLQNGDIQTDPMNETTIQYVVDVLVNVFATGT